MSYLEVSEFGTSTTAIHQHFAKRRRTNNTRRCSMKKSSLYIGMGGWDLFPFDKYFYPPKPQKGFRKLEFYSRYFDHVEVNATFYMSTWGPAYPHRWINDVAANENFMFTVKLFRGFTHTGAATADDVRNVWRMLDPLAAAGKLGGLIMQFPYTFTNIPERRLYLLQLARLFKPYRLFVELRHDSWDTPIMQSPVNGFFKENGMHLVNVDLPQIKRHMPLTSHAYNGASYFRMMGRNKTAWNTPWRMDEESAKNSGTPYMVSDRYNYLYSDKELRQLVELIDRARAKAETLFVVFHNDPEANSLVNGFQLRRLVRQQVSVPKNLIQAYPELYDARAVETISHEVAAKNPKQLLRPALDIASLPLFAGTLQQSA
jgi:uncharacterized protein YecE (DUF72 family)